MAKQVRGDSCLSLAMIVTKLIPVDLSLYGLGFYYYYL